GQGDHDGYQGEMVRWEELKLDAVSDGNGFDRDQLRTGGTDETEKRDDETDGPEAGLVHRHLDGKGSSTTIPSEPPVASRGPHETSCGSNATVRELGLAREG